MRPDGTPAATNVVPLLRYRNVAAAIEWLCSAFGFEQHFVVGGEGGSILYAQLTSGSGMVMIGPVSDSEFDKLFKQPDEIGGAETQSCYVATKDLEAHFERAKSCGAEVVFDLQNGPHGAMGYSCRDLEGHIWNFGTYDPWKDKRTPIAALGLETAPEGRRRRSGLVRDLTILGLCCAALAVSVSVLTERSILDLPLDRISAYLPGALAPAGYSSDQANRRERDAVSRVLDQEGELTELEMAVTKARLELADAISQKERVELVLQDLSKRSNQSEQGAEAFRQDAAAAEQARASAEKSLEEARQLLESERAAKDWAMRTTVTLQADLTAEQEKRAIAERELEETKLRLSDEAKARETAERALMSAQAEETAAKQKLAVAEEELAKAKAGGAARIAGSEPPAVTTASTDTGTKVQAWSLSNEEAAAALERKKKAARARKTRSIAARVNKKGAPKSLPPVIEGSPATFPSPQY